MPLRSVNLAARAATAGALIMAASSLHAEVVARADASFTSQHVVVVGAAPARVFRALTDDIAAWWDPAHSYSGDAANFSLRAAPGGCFCERIEEGGVEHMRVAIATPPQLLRLLGGLGPLQGMAASGAMDFELEPVAAGTRLSYRYVVNGANVGKLADVVDQVQLGQLQRLRRYVEIGRPEE